MKKEKDRTEREDIEVPIEFEQDPEYKLYGVNGLWGGITPRGDLRIDFFAEYEKLPESGELTLNIVGGEPSEERSKKKKLVRRVQVGILVSPRQIRSFAEWFQQKAKDLERVTETAKRLEEGGGTDEFIS